MNHTETTQRLLSLFMAYGFGTSFFFGSILLVNGLKLSYVFYIPRQIQITIIDPQIDLLAWLFTIVFVSALSMWDSCRKRTLVIHVTLGSLAVALAILLSVLNADGLVFMLFAAVSVQFLSYLVPREESFGADSNLLLMRTMIFLFGYFAIIEIASGVNSVVRVLDVNTQVGRFDAGIEQQLSYSTYGLIPWLYLGFLLSWLWVPLARLTVLRGKRNDAGGKIPVRVSDGRNYLALRKWLAWFLNPLTVLALAVAFFAGYYPYFQNPPWLVGTDAYWRYLDPLTRMNAKGIVGGFLQSLKERHPLALASMYAAQLVLHTSAFEVVRATPSFLVAGMGLAVWWLLGRGKRFQFGLVVFLFSVFSMSTIVGLYASILANWIALIVWVLFFAYYAFRAASKIRVVDMLMLAVLSTVILFLHPWTWAVFAVSAFLVGIVTIVRDRRRGFRAGGSLLLVILADAGLALLSLTFLAGSQGWRVADILDLGTRWMRNPASLLVFWTTLTKLTEVWSPFFSSLYLALSILGVFCIFGNEGLTPIVRRVVLVWIFVSAIGSVLVSPIGFATRGESQIWRVFFLTPFQLAAPFGVGYLTSLPGRIRTFAVGDQEGEAATHKFRWIWLAALAAGGFALACLPAIRGLVILLAIPLVTVYCVIDGTYTERKFLSALILLVIVLVVFSSATRGLAQLLLAPHAFR